MDTDDLNVDTLTWPSFAETVADTMGNSPAPDIPVVTEKAETVTVPEVPAEPHLPTFNYGDMATKYRSGAVPEELRPFMIEAKPEGYTPPFYVNRAGTTRAAEAVIPGCPPIEPGGKALVFDDWGNPKVVVVTAMHEGEIRASHGGIPVQYRAWIAMSDAAPVMEVPSVVDPKRLTDEEADALEAELFEWSKFLGVRADKYNWCGTFENILKDVGVKPWRPGFESVTLQVETRLDSKDVQSLLAEKVGGETEVKSVMVNTFITINDVSREDYDNGRWQQLLQAAGYKNITGGIYVHSKKVATA